MRKSDVAYNPPLPASGERKKNVDEMDVNELGKEILRTCAKCHGDFTICEGCMQCKAGRKLINMLKGKTEVNTEGIMQMKHMSPAEKQEKAKKLYHDALMSDDPVQFLMNICGIDEKKAKLRMAQYKCKYKNVAYKTRVEKAYPDKFENGKVKEECIKETYKLSTVGELMRKLKEERSDLGKKRDEIEKRIADIESTLNVIRSLAG